MCWQKHEGFTVYSYREEQRGSLYILTDRSEGGTSLESGVLELMLHRSINQFGKIFQRKTNHFMNVFPGRLVQFYTVSQKKIFLAFDQVKHFVL